MQTPRSLLLQVGQPPKQALQLVVAVSWTKPTKHSPASQVPGPLWSHLLQFKAQAWQVPPL